MLNPDISNYLSKLSLPKPDSHKGQNGKLMIIGGSELFHAASKWSLDIASRFVDMVFYASVPSNNELVREAKSEFWSGIVIERTEIESYIKEADCILIGPGMERQGMQKPVSKEEALRPLSDEEWNTSTQRVVNFLLASYPEKKWVIDAGALQMAEPAFFTDKTIITPHLSELDRISYVLTEAHEHQDALEILKEKGVITLLKGKEDYIYSRSETIKIAGGNAGMTKGGTGDILAGLVAALYCTQPAMVAAVVGSFANKKTGDFLFETVGPYFNSQDIVKALPGVLWEQKQVFLP